MPPPLPVSIRARSARRGLPTKQDCILSGVGAIERIFQVYAMLEPNVVGHPEVTTHPEIFDGVRLHKGQTVANIRHNARVAALL